MSNFRMLSRLVFVALVAVLVAAPVSSAMPAGPHGNDAATFDARGEAAASGGGTGAAAATALPAYPTPMDARGEAAASGGGTGSTGPAAKPSFPSSPTWPTNPTPLPRPTQQPVATDGGDEIGVDLPVALLILAGTLAVGGAAVALVKGRAPTRVAH